MCILKCLRKNKKLEKEEWYEYNRRLDKSNIKINVKYEKLKSEYKNLVKDYEDLISKMQSLLNSAK